MFEVIELGDLRTVTSQAATNHVYVVDVSGSMYPSLPKMRQHLKNIVSMVAQEDDTFTVIYFSGKGQCGIVCEGVPVKELGTVQAVQKAIDRWLTPIGLTGFAEPIHLAIETVKNLDSSKFNNFVMLTDGYDNQSNRTNIIGNCERLPEVFESVSFIEYGWYCDRTLLAKMAEVSGGFHVFAGSYNEYEVVFDSVVSDAVREPKVEVLVNKKAKHAVYIHNGKISIIEPENGIVKVPESVSRVSSIVPGDVLQKHLSDEHLYLILYYAVKTNQSKLAWRCLEALGDVRMIKDYTNAFTRQELTDFLDLTENAALDEKARFLESQDFDFIPDENATTVLDVLDVLNIDGIRVVLDSPYFSYNRIGRATEASDELPRFVKSPGQYAKVTNLVYNSSRPNVSLQTLITGSVELPENEFDLKRVPSIQWRNYAVVKDGLLNMTSLPLLMPRETYDTIKGMDGVEIDLIEEYDDGAESTTNGVYAVVTLERTPVINRAMSQSVDFNDFCDIVRRSFEVKGLLKGLKSCLTEKDGKVEGLKDKYGEEAAKWLSDLGVRDYGFSPKVTVKDATDFYYSTELEYKVKGLSSLPSANAIQKKIDADKPLTVSEYLVKQGMVKGLGKGDEEVKHLIKKYTEESRHLDYELSQVVYTIVIGKTWFSDIEVDEEPQATGTIDIGSGKYKQQITAHIVKKEVKI